VEAMHSAKRAKRALFHARCTASQP
jgi:hypothetical protein